MNKKWQIVILLSLGLLTRFMFFGQPNETVFDEVHFGKFVSAYYTKEFYFDIHPALGKQIIAGFAKLSDFKPEFAFAEIGEKFPNKQYMILRFLPSLASSLLPLVIYLLLLELGISRFSAFMGGLLIVLESALLTQGRYILMDSFMLLFGFSSLLFYFKSKKSILHTTPHQTIPLTAIKKGGGFGTGQAYYLLLAGLFSGMALSIKWIALSFIALPLAIEGLTLLLTIFKQGFRSIYFLNIGRLAITLLLLPLLIYFSVFMLDFSILTKSGAGDAFMRPGFQKTLSGNQYEDDPNIKPSNLFQKFIELNAEMFKANQRLTATHPYSSQWYTWPLMVRPIYYWVNGDSRIYLIGNPIIWWASTVAILFSIILLLSKKFYENRFVLYFLLGGYILNLLPFIGVKRVMFLYHYFTAYIFAIIMLVWLISQQKNSKQIFGVLLTASVILFIYFAPLSYGLELSPKSYEMRVWLNSWK